MLHIKRGSDAFLSHCVSGHSGPITTGDMSRIAMDCPGMSHDSYVSIYHIHMYFTYHLPRIVFVMSSTSSQMEHHHAFGSTPFTDGEGLWLLLRQG